MTTEKLEQVAAEKVEQKAEGDSATDSDGEDSVPELEEGDSKQEQPAVNFIIFRLAHFSDILLQFVRLLY